MARDTDLDFFVGLQSWLQRLLVDQSRLLVAFSGSYTSAVGLTFLRSAYKGELDVAFVKTKEDTWRSDLSAAWAERLGLKSRFRVLDMSKVVEEYESQLEDLFQVRARWMPSLVANTLDYLSMATSAPIVWFGDRNVCLLAGVPQTRSRLVAPFAHLSHYQVRKLGALFDVRDEWVAQDPALPGELYKETVEEYWGLDHLVGIWKTHSGDFEWAKKLRGKVSNFDWAAGQVRGSLEEVLMTEIVSKARKPKHYPPLTYNLNSRVLLDGPFDVEDWNAELREFRLGSVRCSEIPSQYKTNYLAIAGQTETGQQVSFDIYGSRKNLECLQSKLLPETFFSIRNRDGSMFSIHLCMPEEAMESLDDQIEEMLE